MRGLGAFLLIVARPVMILWVPLGLAGVALMAFVTNQSDFPVSGADAALLRAFAYPVFAGLLAGLALQGLQNASFTWVLPGVRWKTCLGFSLVGLAFTLVVVALVAGPDSSHGFGSLLAMGLAVYCLGSLVHDPLLPLSGLTGGLILLAVWLYSGTIGGFCAARPEVVFVAAGGIIVLSLWHKFRAQTFRTLPFLPVKEIAGAFAYSQAVRAQREQLRRRGPPVRRERHARLVSGPAGWVRAALHEKFESGAFEWRNLTCLLPPVLILGVLTFLHCTQIKAEGGLLEALLQTVYHGVLMSPHAPPLAGDKPPHELVVVGAAILGFMLAMQGNRPFDAGRHYPLSREDMARVVYRTSSIVSAMYLVVTTGFLGIVGFGAMVLLGIEPRFDFMPLFLRATLATVVLLPAAQWAHLRSGRRHEELGFLLPALGAIAFVVAALIWGLNAGKILTSPAVELLVLLGLVGLSQIVYRRRVRRYFTAEDLV